ncbi:T9SS type A sorting domain-containing protein [Carboxylicivirga sp. A043]|uniref:T9SS type A sorting domain-containing protein n=1 Tax=Carboxylicivirga litoralis TaxID=2816963 RepID=UPI0021CB390E|nr:T9SS type A sorting domain-containing protein [Carboxylicivirga sp. A043]MCU4156230.1 T9SS type A sorting domain-containing protein [Carboxylicivirga sp. A043]
MKYTSTKGILNLLLLFIASHVYSQTGPGGVGSSEEVVVWLKADAGVTMDGSNIVSSWTDQSSNGFIAEQSTVGYRPTYVADGGADFNNLPVIRFNADFLSIPDDNGLEGFADGVSVFVVLKSNGVSEFQGVVSKSSAWNSNCAYNMYIRNDGDLRMIINNGGADAQSLGSGTIGANTYILSGVYDPIVKQSLEIFYNSTFSDTDGGETAAVGSYASNLNIGNDTPSSNTNALRGDIAEVIIFNRGLKSAERLLLENYLSQKYGITVSSDIFATDADYDNSYFNDYTGVGEESDGTLTVSNSAGFYISETGSSFNSGEYIVFAHNNTVNAVVTSDITGSVEARWARDWWVEKSSGANTNVSMTFDLPEGITGGQFPQDIANYVLLYRSTNAGNYSVVSGATPSIGDADQVSFDVLDANLQNGYYTIGTINQTDSPVEGAPGVTWYTLISGDWDNWETWTLDPSGSLPNNPGNSYPQAVTDHVVIRDGKTVTMNLNSIHCASIDVDGRLDLGTTTGHTFDEISGEGRILMAADNFPSYTDCSQFVDEGQDKGTVVYYGNNYSIANDYTFYSMEVSMSAGQQLTLLGDYTLNGNLTITSGTFRVNNNASTDVITMTTKGNVTVESGAAIRTGSGDTYTWWGGYHDQYHQFIIEGDFTNNGTAYFTNRTSADYNDDDDTGACEVIFNNASQNQTVLCNGVTRFNQLTCDKGVDDTYVLDVSASATANFNLYGRNNEAVSGDNDNGGNRDGNKALRLLAGTLKLGSNIVIAELAEGNTYDIDTDARLWLYANASVTVDDASWLAVYGTLQCSDNSSFNEITGSGTILRGRSTLKFEGGTHNLNTVRTSTWGGAGDHLGAYIQSGGTVNIVNETGGYASFHLPFQTNVFNMSGGTLRITDQGNGGDGDDFAMIVNSSDANSNVSGGTVIIDAAQNVGSTYKINLRAPVWNFICRNTHSTTWPIEIDAFTATDDNTETMAAMPLRVLNDFTIEGANNTEFYHNGADVYIGRNFTIERGATYEWGLRSASSWPASWTKNTTTFNGTEDGELYFTWHNNADDGEEQNFWNFVVNKPSGKKLTLTSDEVNRDNSGVLNRLIKTHGELRVESGILEQGIFSIRAYGDIVNNDVLTTYEHGVTPGEANLRLRPGSYNIETIEGAEFGLVKCNPGDASVITFTSDVYIKRLNFHNGNINIGDYNLKLDYLYRNASEGAYRITDGAVDNKIITSGNASDGGVSLRVYANANYRFPIGIGTDGVDVTSGGNSKYTPVEVVVSDFSDEGYITINPVDSYLKTTNPLGGDPLDYYWRVRHEGFTTVPNVVYSLTYNESDVVGNDSNYYPGRVLGENPYTRSYINDKSRVDDTNNIITYDDGSGGALPLVVANYTAGPNNRFNGEVQVFYSRDNARQANWRSNNTWTRSDRLNDIDGNGTIDEDEYHDSRQPGVNDYPQEGDVAVIGWVPWGNTGSSGNEGEPHGIWIDNTQETCAEVIFTQMKDAVGNPTERLYRSNFQFRPCLCINNTGGELTADLVRGEGMFWARIGDPDFSLMDMGEFAKEDSAYIVYENFTSSGRTINNTPDEVPNLMIANNDWGGSNYDVTLTKAITTNGNFEILGDANVILDNDADGDLNIGRDLVLFEITNPVEGSPSGGGAELAFQNSGTARTVTVGRDVLLHNTGNQIHVRSANGSALDHHMYVGRHIQQTNTGVGLNLCDGVNNDRVTLYLNGNSDMTMDIGAGTNPDLYRLVVNKGTGQTTTATINSNFTIQGATSGVGVAKAIELQNGILVLNHPDIDVDLTTGDDNFSIPSTSGLEVRQGSANASGNSGVFLDGLLKISGGTLDMRGGDNPIIYSVSGNAHIEVTDGALYIGSQLRRDETSAEGVLTYTQTGGTVEVGESAAGVDNRGIFEILNAGSSFTHTAGTLTLVNDLRSNPTVASFNFAPETVSYGAGTVLTVGHANTVVAGKDFSIYGSAALSNLTIDNTSSVGTSATSLVVPLIISEALEIQTGAQFDANGLDLTVGGDFTNHGDFVANSNSTYFNGVAEQIITNTGTGDFYNLYKTTSNQLTLANDITVDRELHLTGGAFEDGGHNLFAQGDMYISITTSHTAGGDGIVACGSSQQHLYGTSDLASLKIDNIGGVKVPVGNQVTITGNLIMSKGIFDIDQNLLVIEKAATITEASSFSEQNMIQTNISFTDAGIKKFYPTISSATDFVYPIGSQGKYTPVTMTVRSMNDGASIRVKAADEHQPTVQDGLGAMGVNETSNVLQYYWILDAEGTSGVDATALMQAYGADEMVTAPNTTSQYITARLRSRASGLWEKYGDAANNDYNESTHELTFELIGGDDQIDGDYTAGIDDAIPDQVAQYISQNDGDWTNASTWLPNIAGGPRGARVLVRHEVVMDDNYRVSYETRIDDTGKLKVDQGYGHRLGNVIGTGTLYLERGDLPAGDYGGFFAPDSGKIEYGYTGALNGDEDYDILSSVPSANTVIVSGDGTRRLPNIELQLHGDLIINGSDLINEHEQKLNIKKNLEFNGGTYTTKSSANCIVNFNGDSEQLITGTRGFTSANSSALYSVEISNPGSVTLNNDIEINSQLTFVDGLINSSSSHTILITNTATDCISGATDYRYVNGPLFKTMSAGDEFNFPVGKGNRYGNVVVKGVSDNGIWEAEYYNNNPTNDGYDVSSLDGDVEFVSHNEYWRVKAPVSGNSANLLLRWDSSSGVSPDDNLRIVRWTDLTPDAWSELTVGTTAGNANSGTADLAGALSFGFNGSDNNHYITFGFVSIPEYTWLGGDSDWFKVSNWQGGLIPGAGVDIVINQAGVAPVINTTDVAQVHDLTIDHIGGLTLQPGAQMTVNGVLTTNNNLIIENTNSQPSSLITIGNVVGDVTIKWTYDNQHHWFIGHAIDAPAMASYDALVGAGNDYVLYKYKAGSLEQIGKNASGFVGDDEITGYQLLVRYSDAVVTHTGTLNNASSYSTSLQDGWQIIANPYNAYYQLPREDGVTGDFVNTTGTVYVSNSERNSNKVFETYNIYTGIASPAETLVNGIIAPSQSFYVQTDAGKVGTNISMSASNRIHDVNKVSLKSTSTRDDLLRVKLTNAFELVDEAVVLLDENGDLGMSRRDSEQRFYNGTSISYIYSIVEGKKAVINTLPQDMLGGEVVLGMKLKAGNHTIRIDGLNTLSEDYPILLEDKNGTGAMVEMDANSEYTFTVDEDVELNDRFVLHFGKSKVATDIDDKPSESAADVKVYIENSSKLVVYCDWVGDKQVYLFTIDGRMVSTEEFKSDSYTKVLSLQPGVYVVKVIGENEQYEQKVFVK